ncbi:MAG: site-specific DNA-methyltransferase [bacterium]|nr:site-specific DNA-methyltransferase [bacterium]
MKYNNKIIQGDTLKILKTLDTGSIDLIITSPPYNKKEVNKGWLAKNVKYNACSDSIPEPKYQDNQIEVLNELFRVTKDGGSMFYNHKIRWDKGKMIHPMEWLVKSNWLVRQEIVWDRMTASNIRGWRFWQVEERIYWLYKPKGKNLIGTELQSKHALLTSIWRFPAERQDPKSNSRHPAPFPITLPARIISSILNDDKGIILDPYAGSGTSLLAARLLGKDYLGIEISDEYIQHSKERLSQPPKSDILKVQDELSKHVVKKTFKQRKLDGEWKNPIRGRKL